MKTQSVAYDRSTAPKDCRISAWFEGPDGIPSGPEVSLLADFTYDLEKSNAQTFDVEFADSSIVNTVRLDFTSNHGSPLLTCIYRLRVHGHEPESVALLGANSWAHRNCILVLCNSTPLFMLPEILFFPSIFSHMFSCKSLIICTFLVVYDVPHLYCCMSHD